MKESLEDYTRVMRGRYARRTCLERKHTDKVLRRQRRRGPGGVRRGASSTYSCEDIAVLEAEWLAAGQPCGKRLAGEMLQLWLGSRPKHHGRLPAEQSVGIEKISAAQIDPRLSRIARQDAGGASPAARWPPCSAKWPCVASRGLRASPGAGALEIDTVALRGGSMEGPVVWALDATDIHSGWTEVRAVCHRGAHATRERLSEIEIAPPFVLKKLDVDNGSEFLNTHFISHFKARQRKVELSRSLPYRKNDNAQIEQKNYTHVRLILGDDRFEHQELIEALNEVLRQRHQWNDLYGAQLRLLRNERQADGKVEHHHEKRASTPCARVHDGLWITHSIFNVSPSPVAVSPMPKRPSTVIVTSKPMLTSNRPS